MHMPCLHKLTQDCPAFAVFAAVCSCSMPCPNVRIAKVNQHECAMQGAPVAVAGAGVAAAGVATVAGALEFEQIAEVVGAAAVAQLAFKRLFFQSDRQKTVDAIKWASDLEVLMQLSCSGCMLFHKDNTMLIGKALWDGSHSTMGIQMWNRCLSGLDGCRVSLSR